MNRQIVDVTYRNEHDDIVTAWYSGYPLMEANGTLAIMDGGLVAAFSPGVWLRVATVDPEDIAQGIDKDAV
jgi:hypothetical protein